MGDGSTMGDLSDRIWISDVPPGQPMQQRPVHGNVQLGGPYVPYGTGLSWYASGPDWTYKANAETIEYMCDVPGLSAEKLKLEITKGTMTVTGKRDDGRYTSKSIVLLPDVDLDLARAEVKDGVLTVVFNRKKAEVVTLQVSQR